MLEFFAKMAMDKAADEVLGTVTREDRNREAMFNRTNQYSANAPLPQIQNSADLMAGTNSMAGVNNDAAANLTSTMPALQMGGALSTPQMSSGSGVLSDPNEVETEEQRKLRESYENVPPVAGTASPQGSPLLRYS
jgi:hypothetical protein